MRCNHVKAASSLKVIYTREEAWMEARDKVFETERNAYRVYIYMCTLINKDRKTRNKIESGRLDYSVD